MASVCDGCCTPHHGEVHSYSVKEKEAGRDWGEFDYCAVAVAENERRGFIVTRADSPPPHED